LPHAAALFGMQHVLFVRQTSPVGQLTVADTPQFTFRLQLFVTCPHCCAPQAIWSLSGAHPQAPLMHVPPSHVPQSVMAPQLSVVIPQRPAHQLDCCTHWHTFFVLHVVPVGHGVLHVRMSLQLSGPVPQWVVHQLMSETQASAPSPLVNTSE
jgi:hypothetical protein